MPATTFRVSKLCRLSQNAIWKEVLRQSRRAQQTVHGWRMSAVAIGQLALGSLVAYDILLMVNYLSPERPVSFWWLGLLLAGGVAAEFVDRLGKSKHERPAHWTDDFNGYVRFLRDRSGRMMWRWAQWTLVAVAAHLFVNMHVSDSLGSWVAFVARFQSDIKCVGLALPWSIAPFSLGLIALVLWMIRNRCRVNRRFPGRARLMRWFALAALLCALGALLVSLNRLATNDI